MKRAKNEGTVTFDDPMLASHAQEQYGFGRKWLKLRIDRDEIRHRKVGHNLIVDRGDIEREWLTPADRDLLERARTAAPKPKAKKRGT